MSSKSLDPRNALRALTFSLLMGAAPIASWADATHGGLPTEAFSVHAVDIWFAGRSLDQIQEMYVGTRQALAEDQVLQLKTAVMAREIFAQAARLEELTLPEGAEAATPAQETVLLAQAYEQQLRLRFEPSEGVLRDIYQREVVAIANPDVIVPDFSEFEDVFRQSYIANQIDQHYRSLLLGVVLSGRAMAPAHDIHAGHDMHAGHTVGETPQERLAYMTAHFEAGVHLYRTGQADMALGHMSHPFAKSHAAEWEGLDAFGFDQSLFVTAYDLVEQGADMEVVDAAIEAGRANLYATAQQAESSPTDIIRFILTVAEAEYSKAVQDGIVSDAKVYQDISGYLAVAGHWIAQMPDNDAFATEFNSFFKAHLMPEPALVQDVSSFSAQISWFLERLKS